MIKFKAKRLASCAEGYCLTLPGNGGEELLSMFMAWGQDRKTQLVIVSATVDGAVRVLVPSGKRLILASVLATIDRVIEKWSTQGVKPDEAEGEWLTGQRKKVLDLIATWYDTGTLAPIKKKGKNKKRNKKEDAEAAHH